MRRKFGGLAVAVAALAVSGSAVAATGASGGSLPTVKVALDGHSVSVPRTVAAGAVTVSTTTQDKMGILALVRLDPGVSLAQAFSLVASHHGDPNALQGYAAIVADAPAPQGTSSFQTVLAPGRYAALDFGPNGRPPSATFTVTKSSNSTRLPAPRATIRQQDFRFAGPATLHDGELVRFENDGYVTHMAIGIAYRSHADAVKAIALLKAGQDRSAQKLATGFTDFMDSNSPGAMQQQTITAKPGAYVLACFMDTEDGREHTQIGMERLLTIAP